MSSIVFRLHKKRLIAPPSFLPSNVQYETIMGSEAYGVSSGNSDMDVYGFCMEPKGFIFPHLAGAIQGFDQNIQRFDQFQQHHIVDGDKEYDINIYGIVKYFRLCADGNPNMIDSLFTPARCVLSSTQVGQLVRENRKLFLSKKCWKTFKGYAYAQMNNALNKKFENSKRKEDVEKHGYSTKTAYHVVRLLNEVEQILVHGDVDLESNREQLKAIRRGDWSIDQVKDHFSSKEKALEEINLTSKAVPDDVREKEIKQLLINCIEHHYGNLSEAELVIPDQNLITLKKIQELVKDVK